MHRKKILNYTKLILYETLNKLKDNIFPFEISKKCDIEEISTKLKSTIFKKVKHIIVSFMFLTTQKT